MKRGRKRNAAAEAGALVVVVATAADAAAMVEVTAAEAAGVVVEAADAAEIAATAGTAGKLFFEIAMRRPFAAGRRLIPSSVVL